MTKVMVGKLWIWLHSTAYWGERVAGSSGCWGARGDGELTVMGSLLRVMESLGLEQHRPQEVRRALAVHQAASSTVLCRHRVFFFLQYLFKPRVSGFLTTLPCSVPTSEASPALTP